MTRPKISVIGAGNVGASVAQQILAQQLGDVVLLDIAGGVAQGKAMDLNHSAPVLGYTGRVLGTSRFEDTVNSKVVVITSGSPRKPGMSRDELLKINFEIVQSVAHHASAASPDAVLIVVTNPLDVMAYTALKVSKFPASRVLGMAGVLDSARFRWWIAEALGVSPRQVEAMVLGGHGDEMVPCLGLTQVAGIPVTELLPADLLGSIIERTRNGGGEIVKLLQTGSAYYAPAASAVRMVSAVMRDEKAILPCSAWLTGEYGFSGLMLGVPVLVGRDGAEKVVEVPLAEPEHRALARSAESVRVLCAQVDGWLGGNASSRS